MCDVCGDFLKKCEDCGDLCRKILRKLRFSENAGINPEKNKIFQGTGRANLEKTSLLGVIREYRILLGILLAPNKLLGIFGAP